MTAKNPILTGDWLRQRHHDEGKRIGAMAAEAGCTVETVRRAFDRLGVSRRDDRAERQLVVRWARLDIVEVTRLYVQERMASDRIACRFGVNTSTVLRALRRNGVTIRHHNDTKRGARARNRIDLDPADVIGRYMAAGASTASVGQSFGVSGQVISRILHERGVCAKPPEPGRHAGPLNPNWRHDLTPEDRAKRRDMAKQAKWRALVYERDGFTCQGCGDARGGNLHAHHVKDHATNKVARWDLSNGVTLCAPCHRAFHSRFGLTGINRAMLEQFIAECRGASLAA